MNRKLFFWLDKLKITRGERIAVVTLLALIAILQILNGLIDRPVPYSTSDYRAIEEEFRRRSALLAEREARILERYLPSGTSAAADTVVPGDEGSDSAGVAGEEAASRFIVNINRADFDELQKLPGIGPAYARRIIDYRDKWGAFKSAEELKEVKGIGDKRLEKIRHLIEF